ncbi:MAG: GntR family transcriptional regulator [Aggregatilineales bacterium]|nr:GntR family transcriptional regulator [Chloroflexota bacterium]HOA25517.1 GntR family transcriptional regulator [Aggregatilineales bacterium]
MQLNRPAPLAIQVAKSLRKLLQRSEYITGGRLPSEPELAAQFGVSRGTIREALAMLEREGMIFRRHGSGTYVNKHALRIQARIEAALEFSELLRQAGFDASIQLVQAEIEPLPPDIASLLDTDTDTPALFVKKLFLADDQPAIYCIDVIPERLIQSPYTEEELQRPIFDFLKTHCNESVVNVWAEIIPEIAEEELTRLLEVDPCKPLIRLEEVSFNSLNLPILFSRVYYKDQFIRFSVLRKKV